MRAWLAAHPEAQADWEAEAGLNAALGRLPDAPVPSNFTARVLQAVEREAAAELRRREGKWLTWPWRRWLPRVAFAAVVVGAGFVSYQQVQAAHRKKLAESVAVVSAVSSLPSPDILKDFDAIRALNPTPASGRAVARGAAMSLPGRRGSSVAALLGASHLLAASLLAQAAANPPAATRSNSAAARPARERAGAATRAAAGAAGPRSPISFFRELLAMNAAERDQALTNRSPEQQAQILAKVREYESLKPDERELRLRVTELRWYLRPLMTAPATNRADQLAMIPEPNRELGRRPVARNGTSCRRRCRRSCWAWNPRSVYLPKSKAAAELQRQQILDSISPARRSSAGKGHPEVGCDVRRPAPAARWHRFNQFFELTAAEKAEGAHDAVRARAAAD